MDKSFFRKVMGFVLAGLALVFGTIASQNIEVVSQDRGLDQLLKNYGPAMIGYFQENWAVLGAAFSSGGAVALLISELLFRKKSGVGLEYAGTAKLRLLCKERNGSPEQIHNENVWRWYALNNIVQFVKKDTGDVSEHIITNIFIVFDLPVTGGSIRVSSPDFKLPRYEVKEFRERFAIIAFTEALSPGILEIEVY